MSKPNGAVRKGATHFETVPVEVVKVIAVADLPTDQIIVAAVKIVAPDKKRLLLPVPARAPAGKKR